MNTIPGTMKAHIPRLPTIPYRVPETDTDTRLAISIPLFHSDFQWIDGGIAQERFQQVHCRGAIWVALSLLYNTDLGAKGVKCYFHIEDRVWQIAKPIFAAFGVDEQWLVKMKIPNSKTNAAVDNVHYGKKFMALIDEQTPADVWLIVDSDAFVCAAGVPLDWHQRLTAAMFRKYPSTMAFNVILYDYKYWTKYCCNAVGIAHDPEKPALAEEQAAYKQIGLPYPFRSEKGLKDAEQVFRPLISTSYMTIPRKHAVTKVITQNFHQCYEDEYFMAMLASHAGIFMSFRHLVDSIHQFTDAEKYVQWTTHPGTYDGYIHHIIFKSQNADPFFSHFYRDLTRNVPIEAPHLKEWQKLVNSYQLPVAS